MQVTLPRRSFLGWTAAIAGCALLTRPALAVPTWDVRRCGWYMGGRFVPYDMVDAIAYDYAMPEAKAREMALRMVEGR